MKKIYIGIVIILVVGVGLFYGFYGKSLYAPQTSNTEENQNQKVYTTNKGKTDSLRNISLLEGQKITSPLTITGEARGWYFEASFPVQIFDGEGKIIAEGPAQAQGDWMTSEFVPFSITLNFTKPTSTSGKVILRKDNPSGLPENEDFIEIPVKFQGGFKI